MRIARISIDDEPRYAVAEPGDNPRRLMVIEGDPLFGKIQPTKTLVPIAEAQFLAPVIPRSKVVGVGRNYRDHAAELGNEVPSEPLLFLKPNTSVIGPEDPVVMPEFSEDVHYEGELAVVIRAMCKDVPEDRVPDVIAGYTCANDVTARDAQRSDDTFARAKGFDGSCPLGPFLVTDLDPSDVTLTTRVDGTVVQEASTQDMVFPIAKLVSYISSIFSLLPGDVILTGTPAGVGPVQPGQSVSVTIDGIGTLTNPFLRRGPVVPD